MLNRLGTELNNTVLIMIIGLFNEQTDNSLGNSQKIVRGFSTDLDEYWRADSRSVFSFCQSGQVLEKMAFIICS